MSNGNILFIEGACCVCDREIRLSWTDLHGEAACVYCGAPYLVLFYAKDDTRINGALPMLSVDARFLPALREYWHTNERYMGIGTYLKHPHPDDRLAFDEWFVQSEYAPLVSTEADHA